MAEVYRSTFPTTTSEISLSIGGVRFREPNGILRNSLSQKKRAREKSVAYPSFANSSESDLKTPAVVIDIASIFPPAPP